MENRKLTLHLEEDTTMPSSRQYKIRYLDNFGVSLPLNFRLLTLSACPKWIPLSTDGRFVKRWALVLLVLLILVSPDMVPELVDPTGLGVELQMLRMPEPGVLALALLSDGMLTWSSKLSTLSLWHSFLTKMNHFLKI